jgi:hypothetical protein
VEVAGIVALDAVALGVLTLVTVEEPPQCVAKIARATIDRSVMRHFQRLARAQDRVV